MLNNIARYFDLQSRARRVAPEGHAAGVAHAPVVPQYVVVSAGVVVEPVLRKYIETGAWQIDWSTFGGRVVFGLIIGIILLPAVYKSAFDPQKPILVQIAALFPVGIGWQSLFTSATKIVVGE
jgi:hypothetical protein